jgi:radical SAM protein with 4Fe4S-binding SPASM domain
VALEAGDRATAADWTETALRQGEDAAAGSGDGGRAFYCQAGTAAFVIGPQGRMSPCIDLPEPAADARALGFAEAWKRVQRFVDTAPPPAPACQACDARAFCQNCPAWSRIETGTLTEPVPYQCDVARARQQLFGRQAAAADGRESAP